MRKSFTAKYNYGDQVYLKTEPTKIRVITSYLLRQRSVYYGSTNNDEEIWKSADELEPVKSFKVKGFR
jgi:hypothetical protein